MIEPLEESGFPVPNRICISIPPLAETELVAWLQNQTSALADAMDLGVAEFDHKAQIDRVVIRSVTIKSNEVMIEYELAFFADYTCSGIEYSGTSLRTLRGQRDDAVWIFQPNVPLPKRSTADEL